MLFFIKHFSATVMPDGSVKTQPRLSRFNDYLKSNFGSGYHFTIEASPEGQKFINHGGHEVLETHDLYREFDRAISNLATAVNFNGTGHYETIIHNFASSISTEIALLLSPNWTPDNVQFQTEVVKQSQENCSAEISLDHAIFTLPRPPKTPLDVDIMQYARDIFHTVLAIEAHENISVLEKNLYDFLEMPAFETNFRAIKKRCVTLGFLLHQESDWDEPHKLLEVSDYIKKLQSLVPVAREHARRQLEIAMARGKFCEEVKRKRTKWIMGIPYHLDLTYAIREATVNHFLDLQPI